MLNTRNTALSHVLDSEDTWPLFHNIWPHYIPLPKIFGLQITKFMILEVIAAAIIIVIYVPIARRMAGGEPPHGAWANAFESLLTFVREQIAKPNIGEHDADRFVPFLWTLFLFILFNNLLGMFPFGGSPTASIYVTLGLAAIVFYFIHGSAMHEMGPMKYAKSLWPHIDIHPVWGFPILFMIFLIEVMGIVVRNVVLAVRLFANIFAGHMVLATILIFIYMAGHAPTYIWGDHRHQRGGNCRSEFARNICRFPASLYLYILDCSVHGNGAASPALIVLRCQEDVS